MSLDDRAHVEAVAIIRLLLADPRSEAAQSVAAQWLVENRPTTETYMAALRASAEGGRSA